MLSTRSYRYTVMRRMTQISVMGLFAGGSLWGWKVLQGNLSTSRLLDRITITDPYAALQILFTGYLLPMEALLGAAVVTLFFAALGGRMFCGWVCPVNVVTDLANWLGKRLGTATFSERIRPGRSARYWILAASLVLSALLGVAAFEWISPISLLHRGLIFGMGTGWTAVLGLFLFDFIVARNGFCGHLCPLGAFYGIIGGRGIIRVYHNRDKCTMCMKCLETCPERQVLPMVGKKSAFVLQAECTNCARCIEVCSDGAMEFHTRFYNENVNGKEDNHA